MQLIINYLKTLLREFKGLVDEVDVAVFHKRSNLVGVNWG
jgi:hypothetical protein